MTITEIKNWMKEFQLQINENKDYLNELDTPIGDGDHGTNMTRGMDAVISAIEDQEFADTSSLFKTIAMTLLSKVGGASGPLYGSAFLAMSKASINTDELSSILLEGLNSIKKRGNSTANEKTMIDTWEPSIEALKDNKLDEKFLDSIKDNTLNIKATKGRASFLGDRSIGHLDPGATSSIYLFQSMIKAGITS